MKKTLLTLVAFIGYNLTFAQSFVPGNLVVSRYGTTETPMPTTAVTIPVFLDEYDLAGNKVSTLALPTTPTTESGNRVLTGSPAPSVGIIMEGLLALSPNGQHLAMIGHAIVAGNAYAGSTERTLAAVSPNKTYKLVAARGAIGNPRHAITADGENFYFVGSSQGVRHKLANTDATTDVQLLSAPAASNSLYIYNGQLYFLTKSTYKTKIGMVGTGLPTEAGQTVTALPGIPETAAPDQMVLFDSNPSTAQPDIMYFTESDKNNLQKWVFDGTTWVLKGEISIAGTTDGIKGITGTMVNGNVTLYTTSLTKLLKFTDNSAITTTLDVSANAPVLLATAAENTLFRGVAFAPGTITNAPLSVKSDVQLNEVSLIYPNPVQDKMQLSLPEGVKSQSLKVLLLSGNGQVLFSGSGDLTEINASLQAQGSGLKPGVYLVKVITDKGTYLSRFIKL
ncbi:MAG: T9SS type A sorting domain-containing protein [Rufibacter sp.]